MNKRYMPDIHGLYKSQKNKKKQMSRESIENELIASGLSESDIEKLKSQAYASQYTFGYKKYDEFMVNMNNAVTILNGKGFDIARNQSIQMEGVDPVLQSLTPLVSDVQQHLKNSQSGSKLIENALDINFRFSNNPTRLSTSLATVMDSAKKFDMNKEFLYFDTETFSGQNEFGYQTLLGMQEFSATKYKRVNGKVEEIAGSKIEALFGLDSASIKDMEKINTITQWIEEFETTGKMPGHSLAEVTLKRLAVEGHNDTKLDYGKNGIVTVSRYASPEAMKGKELNIDLIKKGLNKEIKIGEYQRTVGRVGAETLGNESISASTFEFFKYINELNTNFAMSKNGIAFDAKVLKQEAESRYSGLTNKQKEYIANRLGTKDFHKLTFGAGHLDQENLIKAAIDLYGEDKYFTSEQLAYAQSRGLTSRSLEGIARMLNEDGIYNTGRAAHTAGVDTFAGAFLAVGDYRDGKSFMEVITDDLKAVYGNGTSLNMSNNVINNKSGESLTPIFIAKKSDQFDSSPLDFSVDGLTGDVHFGNKKVMGADGSVRDAVYSPAIKKNVAYEVRVNKFKPTDEMLKEMQKVGDFYNGIDDLYIVSYIPQLDKELANGNEALISPIHRIVQGKDKVEANISNNMIYAFNRDSKGNYRELSVDDGVTEEAIKHARENLAVHTTENGKRVIKETTANEKITKGTFDLMNDSAAREMRNADLKKAQAFINVRDKFREQGFNTDNEIKERIGSLLSKAVSQGENLSLDAQDSMQLKQLLSMVGYKDRGTGNNVLHPGTFKNFYNTFNVFSSMGGTLDSIVDLSKQGGLDSDIRYKEYIRNLRENIAEAITSDENMKSRFVSFMDGRGMDKTAEEIINGISSIENYGFDTNKFEFNISAKKFNYYNKNNANPEDIFTMDLGSGKHYSFINSLMNRHYGADRVKSMTAATKEAHAKNAITNFIQEINSMEEYRGMFDGITDLTELNSVSLAAQVKKAVSNFRDANPGAGLSSKTDMMNVISDADIIAFANSTQEGTDIINRSLEESTKFLKNKKSKVITGKDIDREAQNIVDTVLNNVHINNKKVSDVNEIAKHAAEIYGYTERNIAIRIKHNKDAQVDMVKSIINAVHSVEGGSVIYNKNQIGIKIGNSEVVDITKYLPIMNFDNGILSNKLNNSNLAAGEMISVANMLGADGKLVRGDNAITSTLNKGSRDIKYLKNRIRTKDTDNSKIDTILHSLKKMGKSLRETSQVSIGNTYTEAINSVRRLDMSEIQLAIPSLMNEIMRSSSLTKQQKEVLYRNRKSFANFASDAEYDQIAAEVEPIIARMLLGVSEDGKLNDNIDSHYLLKNFSLYTRDSQYEKFERAAGENEISAFQQLSNYKKPPIHQRRNAKLYRSGSIEEQSKINKKNDNTFNTVASKNMIVTTKEKKLNNRKLSGIIDSTDTIMANRLDIDDKTFKERLNAFKKEVIQKNGKLSKEYEEGFKIASSMNLFEQEKIVNSRFSQMLFKDNDTQFINADGGIINTLINKEKDLEVANELFKKQTQTVPIIKVDKDGKVTFKYGNKQLVSKHETLFTKEGFGGTIESVGANFDGLLGFKYYSANVALSESEITDYLNGLNITSPEEALEALNSRFNGKFAVENAVTKGMNKIYVDVEKGMGRSLEVGAGKINSNIANVLKQIGLEDKVNSFIKEEYLEHVFESIDNVDDILKKNGFSSVNDFMKALDSERHFVNDIVQEAFGNKGIAVFTNDAKVKHESLDMAVKDLLNTAALKKINESGDFSEKSAIKAYRDIYDTIKDSNAFSPYIEGFDSKTGQIITKSIDGTDHSLSLDDVNEVAKKLGMVSEDGEILFGIKNEHGGQMVYSAFNVAGPGEYAGTSGSQGRLKTISEEIDLLRRKGNLTNEEQIRLTSLEREKFNAANRNRLLTIDKRAARTLDIQSYNVTNKLNELESSLNREFLSDAQDVNLFKKYFMSMTERDTNGNVVLKDGVNHKTNAYLMDELKNKAVYNEDLEYLGGGYKKLDSSYVRDLESGDERNLIFKKYYGEGKEPISRNYAELSHASEQSTKALMFNGKRGGITEKELLESGFDNIDINDLVKPTGPGSANFIGETNVPTGKSFILSTTDKNGKVSKIAVPYMPSKQVGDELINTELNKAIGSVAYANKELQDFRAGHLAGNATESQLQERLDNSISNLRTVIKDSAQTVEKELNSVQLSDYKYNKASGILYHKGDKALNSAFYEMATFDGISLGELADQGVYIPAAATGIDFFEEAGLLKESYYSKLGYTSRAEMEDHLRTKGTVGLLGRNPQTEDLSTSLAMVYLDDNRNSGEIKITGELLLAKNGDFDGDNLTLSLIEGGANQQRMHELKKSVLADTVELGAIRKNVLEPKITKELEEATATFDDIFRNSAIGANKNTFINMIDKNISADQVNEYRTITKGLINSIGNEQYRTYDFDQSFDSLMDAAKTTFTEGTEQYNKALEAINFSMAEAKQAMANISNSAKKDIGYMDTPLTELENMANALQLSADDMKAISSISKVMKEAPISKKHDASTELSITNRYRKAWQSAMSGSESGATEVLDIISTMKSDIIDRAKTTDLAFSGISEMSEDEAFETLIKPVRRILDAGQTLEGQKAYLSEKKINELNASAHTIKTRGSIFGEKIAELTNKEYVNESKLSNLTDIKGLFDGFERKSERKSGRVAQEAGEVIQGMTSNGGSGLAKAALGIAASVMMAGYIGGNPTVPADNHAEQMNNYDSLQDEDLSIQRLPQGAGQGYVININAQSSKGQDHAMQAIQKAMQSSVTTDINISMNISDKTSNINSRFIDKLLTGAL